MGDAEFQRRAFAPHRRRDHRADRRRGGSLRRCRGYAAVAVETLVDPETHAGAQYAPTGPQSLTVGEVADIIAGITGRPVTHNDIDPDIWIGGAVKAGIVPADYATMLRWLTGTIIAGNGSRPNDDIEKVIGRPATSFQDFARRNAAAWAAEAVG